MGNNSSAPLDEETIEDIMTTTHCLFIIFILNQFD